MTELRCPLAVAAQEHPDRPALIDHDRVVTYAEYDARVSEAIERLRAAGVVPGERIAVMGPSSIEHIVTLMAVINLEAIACPISTAAHVQGIFQFSREFGVRRVLFDGTSIDDSAFEVPSISFQEITLPGEVPRPFKRRSNIPR